MLSVVNADGSTESGSLRSPAAALAMVFKLVESARDRWHAITGAHLVALVRSGTTFGRKEAMAA
ncbi:hypothetical protein [Streptomyces sp. NPDC090093]|uniref:hypothetical protein n=1 Tax=Streptomyces sp. NPDC090093 TaxID=3365945 RepID=UPI0037FAD4E7